MAAIAGMQRKNLVGTFRKVPIVLFLSAVSATVSGQSQTFTSSGTFTVPAGVTSIIVECWGGGGAGGGNTANVSYGGGGGAGGAYAKKVMLVTPGNIYTVTVGAARLGANSAGGTGNPSWFGDVTTVYAQGGAGGSAPNGGAAAGGAGSAASSIGDVVFAGGNGAGGTTTLSGGGGGGAGSTGTGGHASGAAGGTGTWSNGGNGAAGRTSEFNGAPGFNYGGGGSGAFIPDNTNHSGGTGAQGLVVVSWSVQQTYTSTGSFLVPAGVSSITVECWGAGGAGGGNTTTADGGGGGGGGAYSRSTISVIPGNSYTVTVGAGGTGSTGNGTGGGDSWFGSAATVMARGGGGGFAPVGGNGGVPGTGGSAATGVGTIKYSGGNGGRGRDNNLGRGGPGGSSAGTGANGTSGPDPWSTLTAGAPPAGGGKGGDGGNAGVSGSAGSVPGGGGGGAGDGNMAGGAGANGKIVVTYSFPVFLSQGSADPAITTNWKTASGYSPADFTTSNQTFSIQSGHIMTTTATGWSVSGSNAVVEIQNGGTLTESFAVTMAAGTILMVQDGGALNHFVSSVTIFGGAEIFTNASTVNYGYGGNQSVVNGTYGNLILSASGSKIITAASVTVNGILSMEGTASASAVPAYGTDASLQYKGSSAQAAGPEFPATFSGTGGVIIDNVNGVSIGSTKTIDAPLIFVNGILTTGANTLIIGVNGDILGAGTGKYVNGALRIDMDAATASAIFEIGDASNYSPVSVTFTGSITGPGNITASVTPSDHPNIASSAINSTYSVNRYWTLTNSGVAGFTSYDAIFTFLPGDIDAGSDYSQFILGRYNAGSWSYPALGTRSATTIQVSGLTAFGSYQAGNMVSDFRSAASGGWDQNSTWEVFSGGSWIPAPVTPSSTNGAITIRNTNNVSINSPVSADQVTVDAGGSLTINANVTVANGSGTDLTVNGTIYCPGAYSLTGAGSFALSSSGTIYIGSPDGITASGATGNVQTSSRTFDPGANYIYNGSSAQVTGNGLPPSVNNLTVDNASGVTLSSSVTISNILDLTAGALSTGSNSITFMTAGVPISRTAGTLTTSAASDLAFGNAGNTGGAAFTLPAAVFTSAPTINNLLIYRTNGITLNEQLLSVSGKVLCNGPLNTNNNLVLLSTASGTAFIDGSGTGNVTGNVTMQRYSPQNFGYKYISSPFQAATVNELGDEVNLGSSFPLLYRYDESRIASGWVSYTNAANILNPLTGYSANFGTAGGPVTIDITGVVNNGNQSVTLFNNNRTYTQGFNLVGNPYPSAIDWNAAAGWTKTNIDNALYYFSASATDQWGGTYSTYINGISSDGIASNIIPSMQGFFIHVSNGAFPVTGTLSMTNAVRVTDATHSFIKGEGKSQAPFLRLVAYFPDDTISKDLFVVYPDDKATDSFDSYQDARKLMNTDLKVPNLYSVSTDAIKLSIDALPGKPEFSYTIPLGLKLNRDGQIRIRIRNCDDQFTAAGVSITDLTTGITADLLNGGEYSQNLGKAEYLGRLVLNIGSVATGIPDEKRAEPLFSICQSHRALKMEIMRLNSGSGTLRIFSLSGQILYCRKFTSEGAYELNPSLSNGLYIVSLTSGTEMSSVKIYYNGR